MTKLQSNHHADVGRFMVAVGAVIECLEDHTILLIKRAPTQDFRGGEWELVYGRMSQFEEPLAGLRREHLEEVGFNDFTILQPLRVWHMFRGDEAAENELIGVTYFCQIKKKPTVKLSKEHTEYKWTSTEEAIKLITNDGIAEDIQKYMDLKK